MPIFKLYLKSSIRQVLKDLALHFYEVFLGHAYRPAIPVPLKFAFFKRLSYWCDITYACT